MLHFAIYDKKNIRCVKPERTTTILEATKFSCNQHAAFNRKK